MDLTVPISNFFRFAVIRKLICILAFKKNCLLIRSVMNRNIRLFTSNNMLDNAKRFMKVKHKKIEQLIEKKIRVS